MIPQTRTDLFLAKITGEDVTLPVPQTRFELYLANIAGESYELPAPNSRATLYLAKILGQDVALPVPQTRSELYLASIAGMSVQLPEAPQTREEWYLARWAEDAGYVVITGNPVSFNAVAAKLRQLKIAFSPVQDLHGYGSPWPAGGGVNKLPPMVDGTYEGKGVKAVVKDGIAILSGTTTSTGNALIIPLSAPYTVKGDEYYHLLNSEANGNLVPSIENAQNVSESIALSGSPANRISSVPSGSEGWTLTRVRFYFSSGVTISGTYAPMFCADNTARSYSPYANECPISGWTGVNVWQAGKNLFDIDAIIAGGISNQGYDSPNLSFRRSPYIFLKAGTYTASRAASSEWWKAFKYPDGQGNAGTFIFNTNEQNTATFTLDESVYIRFSFDYIPTTVQLELGSTAHDFVPYDPASQVIPVVFPDGETYYSGWADPTTGDGGVNKLKHTFSAGDVWTYYDNGSSSFFYLYPISAHTAKLAQTAITENGVELDINGNNGQVRAYFGKNPFLSADTDMASFMATYGFVYELAEPVPFHVDPQQINSLAGANNMWSDANGPLTVEYWKDGNVSDAEALGILLGGRYTPATGPEDVPDSEALRIISGR